MVKSVKRSVPHPFRSGGADRLQPEPWPEREADHSVPHTAPPTVHYLWCLENETMRFRHYLGVLSLLRFLRPLQLVFHYTTLPRTTVYDTWFEMLKSSVPGLVLTPLPAGLSCSSESGLRLALDFIAARGGVVMVGQNVILSRTPPDLQTAPFSVHLSGPSSSVSGIIFANNGFDNCTKENYLDTALSADVGCVCRGNFNKFKEESTCVEVWLDFDPSDIMHAETPFAELSRWLFYGRRSPIGVNQDPGNPIPRISHYIHFKGPGFNKEFSFTHYLSVLSALYIAGFDHVCFHTDVEPYGDLWEELKNEPNLTVVGLDRFSSVFQHRIDEVEQASHLARFLLLHEHGGVYQDLDFLWVGRIPDSLLIYPTVAGMDYHDVSGEFPRAINDGVILSRPGAPWIEHVLLQYKNFKEARWTYNSGQMPYRMFELYPDTVIPHYLLQVRCHAKDCFPTWLPEHEMDTSDLTQKANIFRWKDEVLAYHPTAPYPSLASLEDVIEGDDTFASLGRLILLKSERTYEIYE